MFDPTIYDNLKTVLEGCVYDLDLDGKIVVTNRSDRIDLATMSRSCSLRFRELKISAATAEIGLSASLADLAAELLRPRGAAPGCELAISFQLQVLDPDTAGPEIERELLAIWDRSLTVRQSFMFELPPREDGYDASISLHFGRKLDESNADDFPRLVEVTLLSLRWLNRFAAGQGDSRR